MKLILNNNEMYVPKSFAPRDKRNYQVGDIVFYDRYNKKKIVCSIDDIYKNNRYEPIGIVVIPSSHDVYKDGCAGVMALKNGSCLSPNSGTLEDELISFSANYFTPFDRGTYVGRYGDKEVGNTSLGVWEWSVLPSDNPDWNKVDNPYDPVTHYTESGYEPTKVMYSPSPYYINGSRNPLYDTLPHNDYLIDYSGESTQKEKISNLAIANWRIRNTLPNGTTNVGFACCWRYSTLSTKQGDWYLPTMGEIVYLTVRQYLIKTNINKLNSVFNQNYSSLTYNFIASGSYGSDNLYRYSSYIRDGGLHKNNVPRVIKMFTKIL